MEETEARRHFFADLSATHLVNAMVAFVFAISGPVAIILTVSAKGGMSSEELASWLFGSFFVNGAVSFVFCLVYRQPLVCLWTIPGIVLVGTAIDHLAFSDIVGAYMATGCLLLALGLSGWLSRIADAIPLPIVMGMVAGVLLQFGIGWITSIFSAPWIAAPMTIAYLAVAALPLISRYCPPMLVTLLVGAAAIYATNAAPEAAEVSFAIVTPILFFPTFSWQAMVELVVPLMITVVFVQNSQGIAILRSTGHQPPVNAIVNVCGGTSLIAAWVGTVPTCLTGPVNGIISAGGAREGHYTAGVIVAILCMIFGLLAPPVTALLLATPVAFIATLGGIALLPVLQGAFVNAFSGKFTIGALVAFMVTLSEVTLFNIGAPFWGLLAGILVSRVLERSHYQS